MLKFRLIVGIQIVLIGTLLLSACGASEPDLTPTPTIAPDDIRTQAVGTFSADLTATAIAAPTSTPAATATSLATVTPLATVTGGAAFGASAAGGGSTSCHALAYVSDVTIADNTKVDAGEKFTKTWKVQNTGSCAWDSGFTFKNVSGDAMGGNTYTLASSVAAGATLDISIQMTAPNKSGTVRGDWQLFTAGGAAIPNGVYVQVVVEGGGATVPTNTGTAATQEPTAE